MKRANSPQRKGVQGWEQFLASKKKMLDAFDQAKLHKGVHEVPTYHGKVAEAEFRKWLLDFLPKKYGVTSGYIISQGKLDDTKAPHFDVIIYDQLESPVLWIESHPDASQEGMSRAIPVEYVRTVIEIKSSFESSTVAKAFEHLSDLRPLLLKMDEPQERYKQFLPRNFFNAVVFFERRQENESDIAALKKFIGPQQPDIPLLSIILRSESLNTEQSGEIEIVHVKPEDAAKFASLDELSSPTISITGPHKVDTDNYQMVFLQWSEVVFSSFAFDLLALLNGTYEAGRASSFYGMSWVNLDNKPTINDEPLQNQ